METKEIVIGDIGDIGATAMHGQYNTCIGWHSDVGGFGNDNVVVGARSRVLNGSRNVVFGCGNTVTGNGNMVFGNGLTVTGDNQFVTNEDITVPASTAEFSRLFHDYIIHVLNHCMNQEGLVPSSASRQEHSSNETKDSGSERKSA